MKHLLKFTFVVAAVLMLASCYKCPPEGDHVVAYTVDKGPEQRVYLVDNNEWQALLDRFCDYAEDGSEVTFYNANHKAAKSPTKETVTYSTTDREAMKRWMAQMEDEGMTVTVTYDPNTVTYSGTAYAIAPQPQDDDCYTGVLVSVGNPAMDRIVPPGLVAALRISDDSTMIIAMDGQWFWNGLVLDGVTYSDGDTVTLCGTVLTTQDYYGNEFFVLELGEAAGPDPVPFGMTYVCDRWPDYIALITIDPVSNRCYGTWATDNGWSLYGLPWGICSYTFTGYTCLECPQEYHFTNIYWNGIDVSGTSQLHGDTLHMEYGGMIPQCNTCIGVFDMVRSMQYETWVSTNNGYDVVMHIDRENRVAVASTPANYINTIVDFPQGRFHYEDDEYGNRQTYLGVYPPVLDTTPLYGNAYNILQVSPTQEEWHLICDCDNPPTFVFNRVD